MLSQSPNAHDADLVLDRLRACSLPQGDPDRFANGLYRLGKTMPPRLVRTTFTGLRDSGKLRLISNAELRQALSETSAGRTRMKTYSS